VIPERIIFVSRGITVRQYIRDGAFVMAEVYSVTSMMLAS